jgi:cbb3-type cytochrome oxidase subunit 1
VSVGRFNWRLSGRFAFTVPDIHSGVYLLVSFYRFGSVYDVFPASTVLHVARGQARVAKTDLMFVHAAPM